MMSARGLIDTATRSSLVTDEVLRTLSDEGYLIIGRPEWRLAVGLARLEVQLDGHPVFQEAPIRGEHLTQSTAQALCDALGREIAGRITRFPTELVTR